MDGRASNSCPAEWKSRNINFDFYKIKRDLFTSRPMRWLTSQRVSIGRSWVKSDSLQNPLHSTGGSSWLRCRTSFPPPAEIFFLYFHHLFFAFLSDLYWLAHQTESERQLAHDTDFFQRKTSPLLRRWTHQTFPDIFFFSPDCPSLSLWWQPFSQQTVLFRLQCVYIRSQKLSLQRPGDEYIIII